MADELSNGTVKDFDAFWREEKPAKQEAKKYKVQGKEYELPAGLPAGVMLKTIRMQREQGPDHELSIADALYFSYDIFGKENVEEWCANGMRDEQLYDMLIWAMKELQGEIGSAPPNRQRRRQAPSSTSSKTGPTSKRTLRGSTKSVRRASSR